MFTFEQIKLLGEQGQKLAMDIYKKGYVDCYNHTKCMSDQEKKIHIRSMKDE